MGVGLPSITMQLQNATLTAQKPLHKVVACLRAVHIAIQRLPFFFEQVFNDCVEVGGDDTAIGKLR